jgi:hypothetical protein
VPDIAAGGAGGLFIAGTNAATIITTALTTTFTGNLTGSVGSVTGAVGSVTAGVTLAASAIQAIWDALTSALTVVGSIGKRLADFITGDAFVRLGAPAGASVSADIADLPTNAELTTALGTADDATLAAIAALNNLSQANVRTAVGLASANLDTQLLPVANLPSGIKKNTALANFEFLMVLTSDHYTVATGLTVTASRSLDGAAFAACANAVTEVSNGIYKINLAAGDLNADVVTLRFVSATADDRFVTLLTEP